MYLANRDYARRGRVEAPPLASGSRADRDESRTRRIEKMRFLWLLFMLSGQIAMASELPLIEEVDLPKYWVEESGSGALTPGEQKRHAEARRLMQLHGSVYLSMEYTIDADGRVSNVTPTAIEPADLNPALFTVMQKHMRFKAAPGVPPTAVRVRVIRRRQWIPDSAN